MKKKYITFIFIQYLSVGIMEPFFALYLFQREFTGVQISFLLGSMPIVVIAFQPLWSYLSDVLNTRKLILMLSCIGMAFSIMGVGLAVSFLGLFLFGVVYSIFRAPLGPITNAIILDYLEEGNNLNDFGLLRAWGSIAFSISSLLLGFFLLDGLQNYFPWILGIIYLLLAGMCIIFPKRGKRYSYQAFEGFRLLPENPGFTLFLIAFIFIGASLSISMNYQTIFFKSLGAASWLVGAGVSFQAIPEIPFMMLMPPLSKYISSKALILIGASVLPIRWLFYLFVKDPIWILPIQVFHSIAIVSFMVVGVAFIDSWLGHKWRATSQGLYMTSMNGVGASIGLFFAGIVIERYDVRALWGLNMILGILGLTILIMAFQQQRVSTVRMEG